MTEYPYPNREHASADKAAHDQALRILDGIAGNMDIIRRRLTQVGSTVSVEGADASILADEVQALSVQLAVIEALRRAREWHAADASDAIRRLARHPALLSALADELHMGRDRDLPPGEQDEDLARRALGAWQENGPAAGTATESGTR